MMYFIAVVLFVCTEFIPGTLDIYRTKSIRETTIEVNEYNSECTRVVLHIYEGFTWYVITIIVPLF